MKELLKTSAFVAAAAALAITAAVVEPERAVPRILSDQGEPFYPAFSDPRAVKTIEIIDYDEATATARPFQVAFHNGRWVLPSQHDYPVEAGDRLVKTAAALVDLKKDLVRSDSPAEHGKYGVIDPLDQKAPELSGRGKRVTLRDAHKELLADYILGKPVEGKAGYRYVRIPGQKRTYAVKTDAEPSARFADWVNAGLLRISVPAIRRIAVRSYSIDERMGMLSDVENTTLLRDGDRWTVDGVGAAKTGAVNALTGALGSLRIVDVVPKPPSLSQGLRAGKIDMSLETALALRQRGFFLSPQGRLLADQGETLVETASGVNYVLRFGELARAGGDNRYLFVTASYDPQRAAKYGASGDAGERAARELSARFADWFYVISGADFQKLRPRRKELVQ